MIKRANKLTALVAAAATIASTISVVPAFADAKRLGTEDGEFTQAFSYAEGKFIYNGYRTDDDDTAIYFNDGENEEEVDDYDDYDFDEAERYGTKYVTVEDDGDHYLLDLSTGKIDDDESIEDKADNVRSKLKTSLKKADRYQNFKDAGNSIDSAEDSDASVDTCDRILANKYGEVWYQYKVTGDDDVQDYMADGNQYIGVINEDNKYLDLSYVANINIYSEAKGKTVKFENFGDSEEFDKDGNEATLKLVDTKIIDQDDDYLYAITTVTVDGDEVKDTTKKDDTTTDTDKTEDSAEVTAAKQAVTDAEATLKTANEKLETAKTTATNNGVAADKLAEDAGVIAAQNDVNTATTALNKAKADLAALTAVKAQTLNADANVAADTDKKEDTSNYQYFFQKIAKAQGDKKEGAYTPKSVASYQIDEDKIYDDGDMKDAAEQLMKLLDDDNKDVINVEVKDSMIHVAVLDDSDTVKVYKLKFKKDKIDAYTGEADENGKKDVKEKVDVYAVLKDGDTDEDIVNTDDDDAKPYSVDINGDLWILGKGKIYKYDGDEFKELYTCDRSINNLDVYDEDNLVAWEKDDEVFAVLQAGKGSTDSGETPEDPDKPITDKVGWDKNADGTWSFYDANGAQVKGSWVNVGGVWYYLKADGIMATGWLQEGGNWYYLNESGAMQTGWLNDNGTWYFLQPSGAMAYGWLQDTDGRWYYLSTTSGAMLTNTTIDGYVLGANGAWIQ